MCTTAAAVRSNSAIVDPRTTLYVYGRRAEADIGIVDLLYSYTPVRVAADRGAYYSCIRYLY